MDAEASLTIVVPASFIPIDGTGLDGMHGGLKPGKQNCESVLRPSVR